MFLMTFCIFSHVHNTEYYEKHFILGNPINPVFINKSFFLSQLHLTLLGFSYPFVPRFQFTASSVPL